MPRVNVYVPDEMKARMDNAGESVNWSSAAQRAFNQAIWNHATREDPDMSNVVERLRASKEDHDTREHASGRAAGTEWAKQHADYAELLRLAAMNDAAGYQSEGDVRSAIDPEGDAHSNARDFWETVAGFERGNIPSDPWAEGFADGAIEVFEEVKDQI